VLSKDVVQKYVIPQVLTGIAQEMLKNFTADVVEGVKTELEAKMTAALDNFAEKPLEVIRDTVLMAIPGGTPLADALSRAVKVAFGRIAAKEQKVMRLPDVHIMADGAAADPMPSSASYDALIEIGESLGFSGSSIMAPAAGTAFIKAIRRADMATDAELETVYAKGAYAALKRRG
jgi:Mg-chelatase subunit ChlD